MVDILPDDLWNLVLQHRAAACMQRAVRKVWTRFVKRKEWKKLRQLLCARLNDDEWRVLLSNMWIRREWSQEPDSWIYMMQYEKESLTGILSECRSRGMIKQLCRKGMKEKNQ